MAMSMPGGIGIGIGIAVAVTLVGTMIVAWLVDGERMPESGIGYGAMAILLIASTLGAWAAGALIKHRKLLVGLCTGAGYLLVLLGVTTFCFGGQYQGVIPTMLLALAGSVTSPLITTWSAGEGRRRRHKIPTG